MPDLDRLLQLAEKAAEAFPTYTWQQARHMSFGWVTKDDLVQGGDPTGDYCDAADPVTVAQLATATKAAQAVDALRDAPITTGNLESYRAMVDALADLHAALAPFERKDEPDG